MELQIALRNVFGQLTEVIEQLDDEEFICPVSSLNGATMGQHIRHTLEFFVCLKDGYNSGFVNYDKREHAREIEESKSKTLDLINSLQLFLDDMPSDKNFILEASYDPESNSAQQVTTSFYRELVYNVEHAIHHMALVKVGLRELCPHIEIPSGFGIAVSTIKYRQSQQSGE